MKRLFYKMLLMFGFTIKVDNKEVRKLIYDYYLNIMMLDKVLLYVTKVEVSESKKNGFVIMIESYHVGPLIGRRGNVINEFKEFLIKELKRNDVSIDLKECKLWHNLYS